MPLIIMPVQTRLPRWLLTVAAVLTLGACVEAETELSFRTDQAGSLALTYRIDSRALQIGMFDSDAAILPLPLGRRDFEQTAAAHPGLELHSYRSRDENGTTRIEAEYRFASIDALQTALGSRADLSLRQEGGSTILRQQLFGGFESEPGDRAASFAAEFFNDARFSMTVHAPRTIESHTKGRVEGRTARIEYRAVELLAAEQPLVWELAW